MRKQIFFVATHAALYYRVFPLINERKKYGEIIIVVMSDKLECFLREYTDFRVIRLHVNPNLITQKTKHKIIWNIVKSKIEYGTFLKKIYDADIYFFSSAYSIVMFSYLKKLTKNNNVCQYIGEQNTEVHNARGILPLIMKAISKIFLNVEVDVIDSETQLICLLNKKFYKNIIRRININFDTSVSATHIKKLEQLKNKNILFLSSNITDSCGFVSDDNAIKVTNIVMNLLKSRYDECIIKCHPVDNNKVYGKMNELDDFIPSYIPAEFLTNHNWEFVIGVVSTSLILFAKQPKIKVISTIKMLYWKDTIMRDYWLDTYGNLPILMPENESELKEIVKERV